MGCNLAKRQGKTEQSVGLPGIVEDGGVGSSEVMMRKKHCTNGFLEQADCQSRRCWAEWMPSDFGDGADAGDDKG